ncbi:MAG: hypothetical protein N3I35_03100 [Clostridia bacterium]|nr:hypothetical protein [Clostridia bacterium]
MKTRLIIWNDNHNHTTGQKYAAALCERSASCVNIQANGLDDITTQIARYQRRGNEFSQVIIATHGTANSFQISSDNGRDPVVRVGYGAGDIPPRAFINAINPYILPNSSLIILACQVASDGDRSIFMEDLSYYGDGPRVHFIYACTDTVFLYPDRPAATTIGSVLRLNHDRLDVVQLNIHRPNELEIDIPSYTI